MYRRAELSYLKNLKLFAIVYDITHLELLIMRARRVFSPLVDVREFILVENCHPTRERDRNLFAIGMNKIRIIEISNTSWSEKLKVFL